MNGAPDNVEPGTNPAFLYQQNTMRDAMVAALTLNIFNHHADRVVMANIAQLVNVLQSVILTDGADMLLTPTYHVFDMFQPHMDAQLLDSFVTGANFVPNARQISASASIKDGTVTVTCANLSDTDASELLVVTDGMNPKDITATILTGDVHDKNTFENKNAVCPHEFTDFHVTERGLVLNLPACALVMMQFHG